MKTWKKVTLIVIIVLAILVGGIIWLLRPTYDRNPSTSSKATFTFSIDDNLTIFVREFHQYYKATGLTAFPDGGSKNRVQKQDIFLINKDQEIVWQTAYIAETLYEPLEEAYSHEKYANINAPYHEVRIALKDLNFYGFSIVRKCSPTRLQFATRLIEGSPVITIETPGVTKEKKLEEPGIEVDTTTGSAKLIYTVGDLCPEEIQSLSGDNFCNPFFVGLDSKGQKTLLYRGCGNGLAINTAVPAREEIQKLPEGTSVFPH